MRHVNYVKQLLKENGIDIQVAPEMIPGNTGKFEVILVKDGSQTKLHSKLGGEGFITNSNKDKFLDALKKSL